VYQHGNKYWGGGKNELQGKKAKGFVEEIQKAVAQRALRLGFNDERKVRGVRCFATLRGKKS